MVKIILIRHFATAGNLQKRYIGRTDEPLSKEGVLMAEKLSFPLVDAVFASPLLRCRETAKLIYPELIPMICDDFKECDFGEFENKNYIELLDNKKYQEWIDSDGTLPFPQGESPEDFKDRCFREFQRVIEHSLAFGYQSIALVVHGGTIMSILERYSQPQMEYYHWQVKNGKGYIADYVEEEGSMNNICSIQ